MGTDDGVVAEAVDEGRFPVLFAADADGVGIPVNMERIQFGCQI